MGKLVSVSGGIRTTVMIVGVLVLVGGAFAAGRWSVRAEAVRDLEAAREAETRALEKAVRHRRAYQALLAEKDKAHDLEVERRLAKARDLAQAGRGCPVTDPDVLLVLNAGTKTARHRVDP